MRRTGVSNAIAAGLLVAGILIGATGFYVATTNQTKVVTQTETTTARFTTTATSPTVTTQAYLPIFRVFQDPISKELWLDVANIGGVSGTLDVVYVTNSTFQPISTGATTPYLTGPPYLNVSLPLTIPAGGSTNIAITLTGFTYSSGNVYVCLIDLGGSSWCISYSPPSTT